MDQTDRNALDYESCRRVWRRVSPELDPYPEEKLSLIHIYTICSRWQRRMCKCANRELLYTGDFTISC